ncbi:MAG TPA: YncE family protein [Dokdonella sp.]
MKTVICALLLSLALAHSTGHAASGSDAARTYRVLQRIPLGEPGGWDYLSIDEHHHRLFISRSDRVMVVSTTDGKVLGTIADTQGVHAIALVPQLDRGFTSNGRANTLTEFDLKTLKVLRTIPAGGENPDALLYDAHSGHLFAFNGRSHDISVIDPRAGTVVATIPAGGKPEFAVSDGHGHVFVNIEDTAELERLSSNTNQVEATWKLEACEEPSGLAFDGAHQRLFSVCQNGQMAVTDAVTGRHVASVPIGQGPDAAVFDARRQLVFSSNGEDGSLTVIRQDAPDRYRVLANVPTQKSARTMVLDGSSHRLYEVAAQFGPAPAPTQEQPHPRAPVLDGSFTVLAIGTK